MIGHQDGILVPKLKPRMLVMVLLQDVDRIIILKRDPKLANLNSVDQRSVALSALHPVNRLLL